MKQMYKHDAPGERHVHISMDDIYDNNHLYSGPLGYRQYIADRFAKEHGLAILNFETLEYRQSRDQNHIRVTAVLGKNAAVVDVTRK